MSARAERGAALLEATVAVALTAMVTAAAFQAFSAAGRGGADAALRLRALAQAETVLDSHLHPALLTAAAREALTREGAAGDLRWTLTAGPDAAGPDAGGARPALVALSVAVRRAGRVAPLATLDTLRLAP